MAGHHWRRQVDGSNEIMAVRYSSPFGVGVVAVLRQSGFLPLAGTLERHLGEVSSDNDLESQRAIEEIVNMCEVRSLGDVAVNGFEAYAWWNLLDRLAKSVTHYRRKRFGG